MGTEVRPIPGNQLPDSAPLSLLSSSNRGLRLAIVLAVVWLVAAAFVWYHLNRGWVALDDGLLAQSALRVSQGQLSHRDFVENYTGGMSYYHALAFRMFGTNFVSLRIAVFLMFLASVPATFYISSRLLPPIAAGAVTMLSVAWGFPNYPAAMPSWYNLFFAIFGLAALLRYLEDPKWIWLLLAGVTGGISCLAKITGLYYVAAVLLFFLFHEQSCNRPNYPAGKSWFYRGAILVGLPAFVIALWLVFGSRHNPADFLHFIIPPVALVLLLLWREFNVHAHSSATRFRTLLRLAAPFAIGFAIPVAIFTAPYCLSHSASDLVSGVFFAGFAHVAGMGWRLLLPAHPVLLGLMLPILLGIAMSFGRRSRWIFAAGLAVLLAAAFKYGIVSHVVWASAAILTPVLVVAGVILLLTATSRPEETPVGLQRTMLLVSATAMCSLVQFPLPVPIYLCYFAPILVLASAAFVVSSGLFRTNGAPRFLLVFYLLFAALRVTPSHIYATWDMSCPRAAPPRTLQLPRSGGLRVASESAELYEQLIPFLQEHAHSGSMMAIANCAELYFLSGVPNTTHNDNGADEAQILRATKSSDTKLFVVNTMQAFTRGDLIAPPLRAAITQAFPNEQNFGPFQVFWRP